MTFLQPYKTIYDLVFVSGFFYDSQPGYIKLGKALSKSVTANDFFKQYKLYQTHSAV